MAVKFLVLFFLFLIKKLNTADKKMVYFYGKLLQGMS